MTHLISSGSPDIERSADELDELGAPFGRLPSLTQIKELIHDYPEGIGIIKEMLENADDAGARVLHVLADWRSHPAAALPKPAMSQPSNETARKAVGNLFPCLPSRPVPVRAFAFRADTRLFFWPCAKSFCLSAAFSQPLCIDVSSFVFTMRTAGANPNATLASAQQTEIEKMPDPKARHDKCVTEKYKDNLGIIISHVFP
jgi:hypothetical protein